MRCHCVSNGLEKNKMRFLFNKSVVFDTQTPDDLKMKTGDVINAMKWDQMTFDHYFNEWLRKPYQDVQLATT